MSPRFLSGFSGTILQLVGSLLGAQALPIINIQPAPPDQGQYYQLNEQVSVSISYCSPDGGGSFDGTPESLFNGSPTGFNYSSSSMSGCDDYGVATGTVTLTNEGSNPLYASAVNLEGLGQDTRNLVVFTPPPPTVTPDGAAVVVPAMNGVTYWFRIENNKGFMDNYQLSYSCTGVASGCTGPSVIPVYPGTPADIPVTFNTAGAFNQTGTVRVVASDGQSSNQGYITARIAPSDPVIAREMCLRVALTPNAALECGDLRIVHPLPSVRTFGSLRTPTLVYNSQHAHPWPVVHTNLTFASGVARPDSIVAILSLAGLPSARRSWPGSHWPAGTVTRRVGVSIDASALASGYYSHTLEVRGYTGGTYSVLQSVPGTTPVVNRGGSPFGAGWWLGGFEQLTFPTGGSLVWIGGDGSMRRYVQASAGVYVATPVDRPDTLKFQSTSSEYVRILRGGDSVVLSSSGFHVRTVTRVGYRTDFTPDGAGRLSLITVPPSGAGLQYSFT